MKTTNSGRWRSSFAYPVLLAGALLCASSGRAQYGDTLQGHIAASYDMVQGDAGGAVNDGWGMMGGATYRPGDGPLGILTELSYHDFDIDNGVARSLGASDGKVEIWSLTVGPSWHFEGSGNLGFQISSGIGLYDLNGALTDPASWSFRYAIPGSGGATPESFRVTSSSTRCPPPDSDGTSASV